MEKKFHFKLTLITFNTSTFNASILKQLNYTVCTVYYHGPCRAHVVFIPGIRFSILNKLTFQVTWLQMRHPLHLYVGVAS